MTHDEKYANLLETIERATQSPFRELVVPRPELLGDTYEELVENLNRIGDAGLKITIAPRSARRSSGAGS